MISGLFLAIGLLLALMYRVPARQGADTDRLVALSAQIDSIGNDLYRIEGSLQMMSGAQESRIQSLSQVTAAALELQRVAVEQKLAQALDESREGRSELSKSFTAFEDSQTLQTKALETTLANRSETLERKISTSLDAIGKENRQTLDSLKSDVLNLLAGMTTALREQLDGNGTQIRNQLLMIQGSIAQQLAVMVQSHEQNSEQLRTALNERLSAIQTDNAIKLDEMRQTVDEKLHATLEQRLGQSFQLVSERLEQVHRGLGEMQNLAAGVGDLKRVLTNVKARGTWGEVQLEAMIEQVLTPEQYLKNAVIRPGTNERVEIAIRLPGRGADEPVWLPVDAKFPVEDYQRLVDAHDRADVEQVEVAAKALEARIRIEAKTIREKYIEPPHTTDFAIMYLPTEGLYAEVLRRPGLADAIQREQRVVISGPTNLVALLNSLQMGFRTLAIEKRSSEVWSLLGAVKSEFGKFGIVIAATQKKLEAATSQFGEVGIRTRAIEKRLRDVEALPLTQSEIAGALELANEDNSKTPL
jgi:DNA recombination protein RmuC